MTYNVFGGTLNLAQFNSIPLVIRWINKNETVGDYCGWHQCFNFFTALTVILLLGQQHVIRSVEKYTPHLTKDSDFLRRDQIWGNIIKKGA